MIPARPSSVAGIFVASADRIDAESGISKKFAVSIDGASPPVIDEFSVAEVYMPGLVRRPLVEEAGLTIYAVTKEGRDLSSFAEFAVACFRRELRDAAAAAIPGSAQP